MYIFKNLEPRLQPEDIIEQAEFDEAILMDLDCLGEEPSDDELIEDEKRRNDVGTQNESKGGWRIPED